MGFFAWIRRRVRDSVLGGFNDAVEQINSTPLEEDSPAVMDLLRERLTALPAPGSEQTNGNGKTTRKGAKA